MNFNLIKLFTCFDYKGVIADRIGHQIELRQFHVGVDNHLPILVPPVDDVLGCVSDYRRQTFLTWPNTCYLATT
jgi:hypothetical protein